MKIEWNKVTWYSKVIAVIVGVGIFFLGFYLGAWWQRMNGGVENLTAHIVLDGRG